ncbi:MAG: 2OG-Fe(II) oxygenase [Gammaproteobacteria bacterium]|nr:2OG-Fe(II) oxygenase [Gammaproteobacteria bacterium]MBU1724652.1 2OG-Fe(II) oxygenase [Gammaproteobacteria bacterium]MBU2005888.1 2OG-Fe(II) oxygenase [Gammaproteobacteria bacterium]
MTDINAQLVSILSRVQRPGAFYATGKTDLAMPRIEVDGVGCIALPLLSQQISQLVQAAEQAPYGKGEETLVDTTVRKTWQIAPEKIHISGKYWQPMLDGIVAQVVDGLGVKGEVHADLYKMLVYDEGSFFVNHRDTEKAEGMFATLIVALPAVYSGGELRIEHAGHSVTLNLQADDPSEITFAAFYADCVHEVLPVTSGCRIVLTYNLIRSGKGELPRPPDYHNEQTRAAACLRQWTTMEHTGEDIPLKLVYLLEHAYTPDGVAFDALKNSDAAIASVLIPAAEQADCDLYLALVSVEESGWAEYSGPWGRKQRYWEDDEDDGDFEIGEVTEQYQYISHWHTPRGAASLGNLPFEDEELCLPERLHSLAADALHFHEATGNEGASFERSYHRAALVMWPRAYRADALSVGGVSMNLDYLADLITEWQAAGGSNDLPQWREAQHFAQATIANWQETGNGWHPGLPDTQPYLTRLLKHLLQLADSGLIASAVSRIAVAGKSYQREDNPTLLAAVSLLPETQARQLLGELIQQRAVNRLADCGQLLRLALPRYAQAGTAPFLPAAQALLDSLANDQTDHFYRAVKLNVEQVVDVLAAIGNTDAGLGKQVVVHLLAQRKHYPMDDRLIPAVILAANAPDCPSETLALLQQQSLAYLESCIAVPLAAPTDWTREADFKCPGGGGWQRTSQADCEALKRFMLDPTETSWNFTAAADRREPLAAIAANLDVSMTTLKTGRPYTLRFVKNQASYDRKVAQRKRDEANRERLLALPL